MSDTTKFQILNRWSGAVLFDDVVHSRRGTPRAKIEEARAKLVHTSHQSRQIELYITALLMERVGWSAGGIVKPSWCVSGGFLNIILSPAHSGVRVTRSSVKTTTCRIVVSGDFVARSQCAPVRSVSFLIDGNSLFLQLPAEWCADAAAFPTPSS